MQVAGQGFEPLPIHHLRGVYVTKQEDTPVYRSIGICANDLPHCAFVAQGGLDMVDYLCSDDCHRTYHRSFMPTNEEINMVMEVISLILKDPVFLTIWVVLIVGFLIVRYWAKKAEMSLSRDLHKHELEVVLDHRKPFVPVESIDMTAAHKRAFKNRHDVENSNQCGCFHCVSTFDAQSVGHWADSGQTALCPKCGIDAVIGDASGFSTNASFLSAMQRRWFARAVGE